MSSRSRSPRARRRAGGGESSRGRTREGSQSPRRRSKGAESKEAAERRPTSGDSGGGPGQAAPASPPPKEGKLGKKEKKEKKKVKKLAKKEKKRAKKEAKKAKKRLKKEAKEAKKGSKKAKKKGSSSSSSSSSSSDSSSLGLNFVLDREFGKSDQPQDPSCPDLKIQRVLGLGHNLMSFVAREDDSLLAKDIGFKDKFVDGKVAEDRTKDWICQRARANGEACNSRNFVKNEKCFKCGGLKPRSAWTLQARDVKGTKLDGYKYR